MNFQDPDDIIRLDVDASDGMQCVNEIDRLVNKRRGFKASYSQAINSLASLVNATRGPNGTFDRTPGTMEAIQRQRTRLETRFEKLQTLNNRCLELVPAPFQNDQGELTAEEVTTLTETFVTESNNAQAKFNQAVEAMGKLMIDMLPGNVPVAAAVAQPQTIKTIEGLKPNFTLSFDNSPSELRNWLTQYKAYHDASHLNALEIPQQQAFMRNSIHPDVWTAIQQKIDNNTRIFTNPANLEEESCEFHIEEAFTIRYPLITRRYKFFTYQRKGNQTFTNYYAQLRQLALAAQLETMGRDDYLIYRIICGLNDSSTVDKLLAIPTADFNLEEVHRVATNCEAASNYSTIAPHSNSGNVTRQTSTGKKSQSTGNAKLTALKQQGKCIRCGRKAHDSGETCPHRSSKCHNCGTIGHISPVCSKPQKQTSSEPKTPQCPTCQPNYTNFTYGISSALPTSV